MPEFSALAVVASSDMDPTSQFLVVLTGQPDGGRTTLEALAAVILGPGSGPAAGNPGTLKDVALMTAADWQSRYLRDATEVIAVAWDARNLRNANGNSVIEFGGNVAIRTDDGFDVLNARALYDENGLIAYDFDLRQFFDATGNLVLDMSNPGSLTLDSSSVVIRSGSFTYIQAEGGQVRMPGLPTANPADGQSALWRNPITNVVSVGT